MLDTSCLGFFFALDCCQFHVSTCGIVAGAFYFCLLLCWLVVVVAVMFSFSRRSHLLQHVFPSCNQQCHTVFLLRFSLPCARCALCKTFLVIFAHSFAFYGHGYTNYLVFWRINFLITVAATTNAALTAAPAPEPAT